MAKNQQTATNMVALHYDNKVAIFSNADDATLALLAAQRPDIGGYTDAKLVPIFSATPTHQNFKTWLCDAHG